MTNYVRMTLELETSIEIAGVIVKATGFVTIHFYHLLFTGMNSDK